MTIPKRLRKWAGYVEEAHLASGTWRAESWHDEEMYDGEQASDAEKEEYKKVGVDLITINRTFPAVNMILGLQAINRNEITAKARTSKDSELSQTMSESAKFVLDQNMGSLMIAQAFKNLIIPGMGNIFVGKNRDPRKEVVKVMYRDWKECFSDPFASPWADAETCRYKFWEKWVDLDALQAAYPNKKKELEGLYTTLTEKVKDSYSSYMDEAEEVEEMRQIAIGTPWADTRRRRVRPVEIWYTKPEAVLFATFEDGNIMEVEDDMDPREQMLMVRHSVELIKAIVPKMYTAVFCSTVILKDETRSDLGHDQYPNVPFVGYVDRYGFPYGVPRQIRGQDIEVNKRRSMALALMKSRRAIVEEDVAKTKKEHDSLHKEINALDGYAVVKKGTLSAGKIKIMENTELANAQMGILNQSEKEIQEISGANGEATGYQTNITSKVGLENKQQQSGVMIAPLIENFRVGLKMLGERIVAGIQKEWTGPKMLRVTDRMTGADKFLEINKRVEEGIKNNVTQGRYDLIVSEAPKSDTVREKNMNLIIEWVKKSPPEVIPHLMNIAFEMADLPNKEQFLEKIKPLLGYDPLEEDMSADERKAKLVEQLEAEKAAQAQQAELQDITVKLDINKKRLENSKIEAEIAKIMSDIEKTSAANDKDNQDSIIKAEKHEMDKTNFVMDSTAKGIEVGAKILGEKE